MGSPLSLFTRKTPCHLPSSLYSLISNSGGGNTLPVSFYRDHLLDSHFRSLSFFSEVKKKNSGQSLMEDWCAKYFVGEWIFTDYSKRRKKHIRYLLNSLYCCSKGFDAIFVLLVTTNSKSYNILLSSKTPSRCRQSADSESASAKRFVEEVYSYAAKLSLQYPTSESSTSRKFEAFVDFPLKTFGLCRCIRRPIYVAVYMSRPDIVLFLLKYGARIPQGDICSCLAVPKHPLLNVLNFLRFAHNTEESGVCCDDSKDLNSVLLLLVDIPCGSSLWNSLYSHPLKAVGNDDFCLKFHRLPSLKHICRTEIRRIFRELRRFPLDLRTLELPNCLKSYILLDD